MNSLSCAYEWDVYTEFEKKLLKCFSHYQLKPRLKTWSLIISNFWPQASSVDTFVINEQTFIVGFCKKEDFVERKKKDNFL